MANLPHIFMDFGGYLKSLFLSWRKLLNSKDNKVLNFQLQVDIVVLHLLITEAM